MSTEWKTEGNSVTSFVKIKIHFTFNQTEYRGRTVFRFISSGKIIFSSFMPFIAAPLCVYREATVDRKQGKKVHTAVKKL